MDRRITNNLILGIFAVAGLIAFVFIIFNIGGGQGVFSSHVTLYGRFAHVKGLHQGSEVSLAGLRVGVVKAITIAPDGSRELIAEMSVNKKYFDQIRKDSIAQVVTQGVLGDKYIEISIGTPSSPQIEPNSLLPTVEVGDLFTKGGGLIEGISRHFDKGGNIDALITNLNKVAQNIVVLTTTLQNDLGSGKGLYHEIIRGKSGESVSRGARHFESILKKIDEGEGSLGALINDPSVYEDLKTIVGGAKRSNVLKYFMRQFMEDGKQGKK